MVVEVEVISQSVSGSAALVRMANRLCLRDFAHQNIIIAFFIISHFMDVLKNLS